MSEFVPKGNIFSFSAGALYAQKLEAPSKQKKALLLKIKDVGFPHPLGLMAVAFAQHGFRFTHAPHENKSPGKREYANLKNKKSPPQN